MKTVIASMSLASGERIICQAGKSYSVVSEEGSKYVIVAEQGSNVGVPKSYFGQKKTRPVVGVKDREGDFELIKRGGKNSRVRKVGDPGKGEKLPNETIIWDSDESEES